MVRAVSEAALGVEVTKMPWKLVRDPQTGQMMLLNTDTGEQKPATSADMSTIDPRWQGPLQDNINRVTIPRTTPAPVPLNTQTTIPTTQETVGSPAIPASNEPSGQYIPTPEYKPWGSIPGRMVQGIPDALKGIKELIRPTTGFSVSGGNPKYEGTKQAPIVAADQRLASKPVKPELPLTLDESKATSEENYRENPMAGTQTIKEQPNDGIQRSTPQQIVYDYARRYQNASDAERKAILNLGFERDMANAMSRMVTSGSHKRLELASPTFTTGSGEAAVAAAQLDMSTLEKMQTIDPNSPLSKSAQEIARAVLPDDILSKIKGLNRMSHDDIVKTFPVLERSMDSEWRRNHALALERLSGERLDIAKEKSDRISQQAEKSVTAANVVLGELEILEQQVDSPSLGPVAGRWTKFKANVGITDSEEAKLLSDIKLHTMMLQNALAGIRGAASPELHQLLTGLTPEVHNNPEAFKSIINAIKAQMKKEIEEVLKIQELQGRSKAVDIRNELIGRTQPTTSSSTSGRVILRKEGADPPVLDIPESETEVIEKAKAQGYQ